MSEPRNDLIARLPRLDRARLLAACQPVTLGMGETLWQRGDITSYAYFPVRAYVSMLTRIDAHPSLEVGLVGNEGMVGLHLLLGIRAALLQALVQGPGLAWRIGAVAFKRELSVSPPLQQLLQRYLYVRLAQQANAAGCLRFHMIGPRLARWLLMTQDRAHSDSFQMTHEFLASMLGVRRVGVTAAAGAMQRAGLIRYHRGDIQVLDRPGLEAAACSCYASERASLEDFLD
ncbi:Crp/Fnr family transcriptional regulator [Paucibacter sp. JuS9]|uniref:Crp/Fnr family transcriptional regulator n=1 Tax=Paucibacter sp. JuS9 TaxID=3228748 RepID=UPI00375666B6